MYFGFIYDNNYIKSDRDFFGDAIICFYPAESKESYVYLLGQMIGAIEFFKGLIPNSNVEQFKLEKLIFYLKPLNSQFLMIIATDQMTLSNELLIKSKLALLFNLVKLIHGPILNIDRTDEANYNSFKDRINNITTICYNLVLKAKKNSFNSYFGVVALNTQVKFEARIKYLMNYSIKKLKAFTGLLFYNDRVFSTRIKNHLMINVLYFLTNEETNLLDKCERLNESLNLPSGCHLVKIYLPKRLVDRLISEPCESSNREKVSESSDNEMSEQQSDESDLVMDVLPETTRFHTTVSINSIHNVDLGNYLETSSSDFYENEKEQELVLYVQKNSKLKIILMSLLDTDNDQYQPDNIIRIWQKIVTNFGDFEYELMEEKWRIEGETNINKNSSNDDNLVYSCVIDRNQMIKTSYQSNKINNGQIPISLMSNMNLYYELIKSIPELSKLDINRKSYTYSFAKQNLATISSSTLQQYNLNESLNEQSNGDKINIEIVDNDKSSSNLNTSTYTPLSSLKTNLNYGDILIQCTQNQIN